MDAYELSNEQRVYFGLDPIEPHWERVILKGDTYRPDTFLYYDGQVIKRHIESTEKKYVEVHYNELTRDRTILLPKTDKGKEKKLTASVLEQRQPQGIYLCVSASDLFIASYTTQTTFYSSYWEEKNKSINSSIGQTVLNFIEQSPPAHLAEIKAFKKAGRKNVKYKVGDCFAFKLNRTEYGFGRLLLNIYQIRKKGKIHREHGLGFPMGHALLIQLFAYKSAIKEVDISILDKQPKLPSDLLMDNLLLYGEYEVIGHKELNEEEFEFPISYGKSLFPNQVVFLQWGLIHKELPNSIFNKYTVGEIQFHQNPYGYYSIGFSPAYDSVDIVKTIENNGVFKFDRSNHYKGRVDLRNPNNEEIKNEIFVAFGLNPKLSYVENCRLTGTISTTDLLKQL
jgi:hypothetical protein